MPTFIAVGAIKTIEPTQIDQVPSLPAQVAIQSLQSGQPISYISPLKPIPLKVPLTLRQYFETALTDGYREAGRCFLNIHMQFQNGAVQNFLTSLFHHIEQLAPNTSVELSPSDLFHGHLFVYIDPNDPSRHDMGEVPSQVAFPRDYPGVLAAPDPRPNSKTHSNDPDYHLRNYLWLMSTNKIYQFNPKAAGFPRAFIHPVQAKYFTVSDDTFASIMLGVINYDGNILTLEPRGGLAPELVLASAPTLQDQLERSKKLDIRSASEVLSHSDPASKIYSLAELRIAEILASRKKIFDKCMATLVAKKYDPTDAESALKLTKTGDCSYSVFRAECILAVMKHGYKAIEAAQALLAVDPTGQDVKKALQWLCKYRV